MCAMLLLHTLTISPLILGLQHELHVCIKQAAVGDAQLGGVAGVGTFQVTVEGAWDVSRVS